MTPNWPCPTCLVPNDHDVKFCVCCYTARPDSSNETTDSTSKADKLESAVKESRTTSVDTSLSTDKRKLEASKDMSKSSLYICGSSEMDQIPLTSRDRLESSSEFGYEAKLPNPVSFFQGKSIKKIACGALHSAVLLEDGTVFTFGCNDLGALGREVKSDKETDISDESEPLEVKLEKVVDVTCGDNHTCFLTSDGDVYLTGSFKDSSGPIGFTNFQSDKCEVLDKSIYPVKVKFDENSNPRIAKITSGENHLVCLTEDGNVHVLGSNEYGQLLQPIIDEEAKNAKELKHKYLFPQLVDLTQFNLKTSSKSQNVEKITEVFSGYATTFFLTSNKRVFGCGRNAQGELGVGSTTPFLDTPVELLLPADKTLKTIKGGQFFSIGLTDDGTVYTWGKTCFTGQSTDNDNLSKPTELTFPVNEKVLDIFVGSDYSFAKLSSGKIYGWGSCQNYVLGNGEDKEFQYTPALIDLDYSQDILAISGGSQHTTFHVKSKQVGVERAKKRKITE